MNFWKASFRYLNSYSAIPGGDEFKKSKIIKVQYSHSWVINGGLVTTTLFYLNLSLSYSILIEINAILYLTEVTILLELCVSLKKLYRIKAP